MKGASHRPSWWRAGRGGLTVGAARASGRWLADVPAPTAHIPTDDEFYLDAERTKVNLDFLKQHLIAEGRLSDEQAMFLVTTATEILKNEDTLIDIDAPLTGTAAPVAASVALGKLLR